MQKESTTKNADFNQLVSEIFTTHSLQEVIDDLDKWFFEFANNKYADDQEKACATVSYFHLKKFLQCIIESKPAKEVAYFMVRDIYC